MKQLCRQSRLVRDHLYSAQHLTSWQAEGVYRIRRLASRISELKNSGYDIVKERMEDATGQPYTRYSFSKAQRRSRRPLNLPRDSQRRYTAGEIAELYEGYCGEVLDLTAREIEAEVRDFATYIQEKNA